MRSAHLSGVNPPSLNKVIFVHGLPSVPLAAAIQSAVTCFRESGSGHVAAASVHSLRNLMRRPLSGVSFKDWPLPLSRQGRSA